MAYSSAERIFNLTANDRTGVGSGSGEWRTPPELFARLNRHFQFDYDAFASHENALCDLYSTIDGTYRAMRASLHMDGSIDHMTRSDEDGLTFPWEGRRVFMNPPYSRGLIEKCVEKAFNERDNAAIIVALLPAATETRWFQRYILPYCHIDWLPKRVRFIDPVTLQVGGSPPSGMVIATFKTELMP